MANKLFEQVKHCVSEMIRSGKCPVGETLPPAEHLATRIKCSEGTVRRALTELAQEGVVKRIQRRGTVVAKQPGKGNICLLLAADAHRNLILQGPVYIALNHAGYNVDVVPVTPELSHVGAHCGRLFNGASNVDLVALEQFSAHSEGSGRLFLELLQMFDRRVVISMDSRQRLPDTSIISPDQHKSAQIVIQHLISLGHKHVAVSANGEDGTESWIAERARYGQGLLEVTGADFFPLHFGDSLEESALDLVRSKGVSAFWLSHDYLAISLVNYLHRAGVGVPEDVSVIGGNDTPWSWVCRPPLTTVSLNPDGIAEAILAALERPGPDGQSDHFQTPILVPPLLVARESAGPPPSTGSYEGTRQPEK